MPTGSREVSLSVTADASLLSRAGIIHETSINCVSNKPIFYGKGTKKDIVENNLIKRQNSFLNVMAWFLKSNPADHDSSDSLGHTRLHIYFNQLFISFNNSFIH